MEGPHRPQNNIWQQKIADYVDKSDTGKTNTFGSSNRKMAIYSTAKCHMQKC